MSSEMCKELRDVGERLKSDDMLHSGDIVIRASKRMATMEDLLVAAKDESLRDIARAKEDAAALKVIIEMAYDIVDLELLPNVATMAIQDFGRLNDFMMAASPIKKRNKDEY